MASNIMCTRSAATNLVAHRSFLLTSVAKAAMTHLQNRTLNTPQNSIKRWLTLHEYQSKKLLEKFGLNVQPGEAVDSVEDALKVAQQLKAKGAKTLVIKSQVLAGGRGKGTLSSGLQGGVQICTDVQKVPEYAKKMLGYRLKTHQTTENGELVKKVLIVSGADIKKELYLALVMDRALNGPVAIVSKEGGVDIEEVAATNPSAIKQFPIDIKKGMTDKTAKDIAAALGFTPNSAESKVVIDQLKKLYELFINTDSTQVEINPLAIINKPSSSRNIISFVDAKFAFDDNAAYRQKDLFAEEDKDTRDPRELAAEAAGLNFVGLDGTVGCLVNGAGLAMATMDIIKLHGGQPANFLDVGGGADENQVTEAFRILKGDKNVKVLFVNIFGGIMKCDTIAQGLLAAAESVDLRLPLVVRLVGNRVDIAKQILRDAVSKSSTLNLQVIDDFDTAAQKAVKLSRSV